MIKCLDVISSLFSHCTLRISLEILNGDMSYFFKHSYRFGER